MELQRTGLSVDAGAATIGVRPEDFRLSADTNNCIYGQVSLVERLGGEALAYVNCDASRDEAIVVKLPGDAAIARNDFVHLSVSASACHLFDAAGSAIGAPA